MGKYIIKRIGYVIIVLISLSIIVFLLAYISGDPVRALARFNATPEELGNLRKVLGLDKPLYVQYMIFVKNLFHGDLGDSYRYRTSALDLVLGRMPATLELACASSLIMILISMPLGLYAGWKRTGVMKQIINLLSIVNISTPLFWFGIILILIFSLKLGWLPSSGHDSFKNLIMPAFTLSINSIGLVTQLTMSSVSDELEKNYVLTAKSKGIKEIVINLKHILRNALIPIITVIGLQIGQFIGGTVIVETIFGWAGVGWLLMQAILVRDLPLIRAIVLMMGVFFTIINLIIDILYCYLNPQIRYEA